MTGDLFYFIAALPSLRWGERPPCTSASFLEKCREEFGAQACRCLEGLTLVPDTTRPPATRIQAEWMDFEVFTRNTVADIRRMKLRRQGGPQQKRPTGILSPAWTKRIEEIMAMPSPAERENALDKFRWAYLEDLSSAHYFDFSLLELYLLKLLLLEKQASRNMEAGRKAFDSIMEKGLAGAEDARKDAQT